MSVKYYKYKSYDLDNFTITDTNILAQNQYFTVELFDNKYIIVNNTQIFAPDYYRMGKLITNKIALCENHMIILYGQHIVIYVSLDGKLKIKCGYIGDVDDRFNNVIQMYSYFIIINNNATKSNILFDINDPTCSFNNVKTEPVDATIHKLAAIDRSGTITWFGSLLYADTLLYADGKTYNFIVEGWPKDAVGKHPLFHLNDIKWISSNYFVFYIEYKTIVIIIDLRNQCRLKLSFNKKPLFSANDEYIILPYGKIGIIAISSYGVKEVDTTQEYTYTHGEFTSTPPKRYTIIMPKSTGAATKPAVYE